MLMRTAEAVSPAHPDKICDRISDAILDACLEQDPNSRVAVETMGGHGQITITGEITAKATFSIDQIVERIAPGMSLRCNIVKQSSDIAAGVDPGGAGDQGIMIGYACRDNEAYIPNELYLARHLCKFIYDKHPRDGKTQVTIKLVEGMWQLHHVLVSWQNLEQGEILGLATEWLREVKYEGPLPLVTINPAGFWVIGGFDADTGVTGRKIVQDAYGPNVPVGGGAFSGKDPTKVDRSAAYMARYLAVHLLEELEIDEVLVKLAYGIGMITPLMLTIDFRVNGAWYHHNLISHGDTISVDDKKVEFNFDLSPKGIIEWLKLQKPQYEKLAEWGSFGHNNIWD